MAEENEGKGKRWEGRGKDSQAYVDMVTGNESAYGAFSQRVGSQTSVLSVRVKDLYMTCTMYAHCWTTLRKLATNIVDNHIGGEGKRLNLIESKSSGSPTT